MTLQISWATETTANESGENIVSSAFHLLAFDAVLREEHEAESDITDHVVETTEAISDHKRPKPQTLRIEGAVTNTPLGVPPPSGFGTETVTAEVRKNVGDAKASVVVFSQAFDRIADVESSLDRLRREAIDLTVETTHKTYENVQLVSVKFTRTGEDASDQVVFVLTLREVFRGSTVTVDAPAPREPRGSARSETATEAEDEDVSEGSYLSQLIGLI